MDHNLHRGTFNIRDDMTLPPLDLLAGIITPWTPAFGGLDTLAVNNACTGAWGTPNRVAGNVLQTLQHAGRHTALRPGMKIIPDSGKRGTGIPYQEGIAWHRQSSAKRSCGAFPYAPAPATMVQSTPIHHRSVLYCM